MNPQSLINGIIDPPKEGDRSKEEQDADHLKFNNDFWLTDKITQYKLQKLKVVRGNFERQLLQMSVDPTVKDNEQRIVAMRLAILTAVIEELIKP